MKKRAANFELLRVISMILIILLHSLSYGGTREIYSFGSVGYVICSFFRGFSYLGVNCFVMLTGWFMCESSFRIKRVMQIWLQVVFYGMLSGLLLFFTGEKLSINSLLNIFLPITNQSYWFVSSYVLLLLLQPILNIVICNSDEKKLRTVVIILITVFSLVPTFLPWSKSVTSSGTDILWFVTLYFSAGYLKKYGNSYFSSQKSGLLLLIGGVGSGVVLDLVANGILSLKNINIDKLFYYNNTTMFFVGSVGLFVILKNLNSDKLPGWILSVASTTFGIYLLHDNTLLRSIVWSKLGTMLQPSANIYVNLSECFAKVIIIFLIGMVVDLARQFLFRKMKVNEALEKLEKQLTKAIQRIGGY